MKWQADREKAWREITAQLRGDSPESKPRILILAAHPDDETIGASMLLSRFPDSFVAFVTDGAPRNPKLWPPDLNCSREEYAGIRLTEANVVLGIVGISAERIFWLGGVDQEAAFEIDRLADGLKNLLVRTSADVVITHPYEGGHPDHDSAALVARVAISSLDGDQMPTLLEMTSYHVHHGQCVTGEFLKPEGSLQISFELLNGDRERKRRMLETYVSQRLVLEGFPVDQEPIRLAPEYDFSKPPHEGKLWYESMDWMTGTRWRELTAAAIGRLQEQACR
jgi:N-acetylglucosamine malate deacetylase 2